MQIVQAKHNDRVTFPGMLSSQSDNITRRAQGYVSSSSPNRTCGAQGYVTLIIADPDPHGSGVTNPHHRRTEITWLRGKLPTSLPIRTHVAQRLITRIIANPNPRGSVLITHIIANPNSRGSAVNSPHHCLIEAT